MKCSAEKFARMYESVYIDLYRFALCRMKNPQEAEDAVSESVLAAFEHVNQLKNEASFKSWIFTILANQCRKKLKESCMKLKIEEECEAQTERVGHEPDYGMALDVRKAFFILGEEEQEIIALSVFGGYNSKEIGKWMRLNPNTVRSKRSRALEKMQCVLE